MKENLRLYEQLYTIRKFEETILEQFPRGVFYGTTHTYLGQEANAAGIISNLLGGDAIFSNHRCHGHFLAYGGDAASLFAELMGKQTGVSGGRGGSQHLHWKDFYSNGIQGGIVPQAAGMAFAEKVKGNHSIVTVFIGDGTLGEGVVYETLNMIGLWNVPLLIVVENNRIAQSTPTDLVFSGDFSLRFQAFNVEAVEIESSDVLEIQAISSELIDKIRRDNKSRALIVHTHRFGPHSKGDDTRPKDLIDGYRNTRDPLVIHRNRIKDDAVREIEKRIDQKIEDAFNQAISDPFPKLTKGAAKS